MLTAACTALGGGAIDHALAQKGSAGQDVRDRPSGFFSFDFLNQDRARIQDAMAPLLASGKIDKVSFRDPATLQNFYAAREDRPLWVNLKNNEHGRIRAVFGILNDSWTHALNPNNYHVDEIFALINAEAPEDKAKLELLVSDAVARYGRDLTGMHLSAAAIRQDPQFWRKPMEPSAVLAAMAATDNPAQALGALAPHDELYIRLRRDLIAAVNNPDRAGEAYIPMAFGGFTLRPGDISRDVPKLRGRMGLTYDPAQGPERRYDDVLAARVRELQIQNGLEPDGNIGPKTLALLNLSTAKRIDQIVVNMERLRWLDDEKPARYVLVNIPSQTLWAMENGRVGLEMAVIVGRPERATKSFVANITGVRFNPKWTVPPTIKANDFLPKLMEDPNYLATKGIEVSTLVDGKRQYLDPASIDWTQVTPADLKRLHMVQPAGDHNALGHVRVLMDNPYDIYLHDTNTPEFFSKKQRALSSGCVRMSNPEAMARFILTGLDGWNDDKMRRTIDSGRTTEITAPAAIPVYLVYQTIWLDSDGRLVYGPDIYGQDKTLLRDMAVLKSYAIPEPPKVKVASLDEGAPVR